MKRFRVTALLGCFLTCLALAACGGQSSQEPSLTPEERLALPPDTENGQRLFLQCAVCHERVEGTGHRVGPNLWGIYGAEAAQHADFTYSKPMERSGLVWTEENLDAYLEDPKAVVPGGRMAFEGVKEEADRRDLIAYLKTLQ